MNRKQREQKLYDVFENNKKTEIKERKKRLERSVEIV